MALDAVSRVTFVATGPAVVWMFEEIHATIAAFVVWACTRTTLAVDGESVTGLTGGR